MSQSSSSSQQPHGYATLVSISILSVIGMALTLAIIIFGLNSSEVTYKFLLSHQARMLAISCSEEALEKLREDKLYSGSGSTILGNGNCLYFVLPSGGEHRIIHSAGIVDGTIRKVKVTISAINPNIVIDNIQDVLDFCETPGCSDGLLAE